MSSDNDPPPKPAASSFADVFKTLASGRRKSLSPLSASDSPNEFPNHGIEARRGSRVTFGFEGMSRGSISNSSLDHAAVPSYEAALENLKNPVLAVDEVEVLAKHSSKFTPEQIISLWEASSYLLCQADFDDARQRSSRFLDTIVGRPDLSTDLKTQLCKSILASTPADVIPTRVNALIALSDNGRKLDIMQVNVLPALAVALYTLFKAVANLRSKAKKSKQPRTTELEESHLENLFDFILNVITLQNVPLEENDAASILEEVLKVCRKTASPDDLKSALSIFDAIISCAEVPDNSFVPLLEVLCSIHASVKTLSGRTSQVIRNIVKSSKRLAMLELLYSFLEEDPEDHGRNLNVVRGAVETFTDIIRSHDRKRLPELSFPRLVDCLQAVVPRKSGRLYAATLELCANLLDGDFASICIEEPDWTRFANLLIECSGGTGQEVTDSAQSPVVSPTRSVTHDDHLAASVSRLSALIEQLWEQLSSEQQSEISLFLRTSHRFLSPTQARLLINHLKTQKSYFPGTEDWEQDAKWLVDSFLQTPGKVSDVRAFALEALEEAMFQDNNLVNFEQVGVIDLLLRHFADEKDTIYLSSLVSVMIEIAARADSDIFHFIIDALSSPMSSDLLEDDDPAVLSGQVSQTRRNSASVLEPSLSNVCMMGLVRLFLRFLNLSAQRAALLFEALIFIVKTSRKRPADAMLTVLKLLFRLRCDSSGAIWVTTDIENDFLVAVLSRSLDVGVKQSTTTEGSVLERSSVNSDDSLTASTGRLSLRNQSVPIETQRSMPRMSSSYLRGSTKSIPPSWVQIDSSLPDEPSMAASPFVYAYKTVAGGDAQPSDPAIGVLKINVYLETIIDLLQKRDTPWDVYSYILAHLGPQLSNRDFFSSAVPQIQMLRNILCGQIKGEMFREPPAIAGIKKADVAICIFDCLAMLVGFHSYFAKSEQDELVRAFMLGIGSWDGTSRGCIHALSVCCHEIPLSVTKSLNTILDKMSKVITMAHVAVHILEFLALLARLPDVYVNLREEEIRTVFGICIRFIQTSREQRLKSESAAIRASTVPARLSGGLREIAAMQSDSSEANIWQESMSTYVYTLTYHVLVFWFLSLKLQDRANHVNWITSRLIFTDELGQEVVEEQTEVFIDLMQRVTYSDLGDTIPYETFPPSPEDGPVSSKSWIVGMSIVTVETAGVSGLTQITKRMASGTTYAEYRQRTAPVLPHQVPATPDTLSTFDAASRTAILPSHVLLQMVTSAFPTPKISQPIPLPDDAMTRRAISSFDRNDIVDGHKVGVIFIDNNQTTEAEILANTAGSPDYNYFLDGLGTRVSIRGAQFNTQGLHSDIDGEYTYAWRDRVTEMVYHVTTMMPTNLESDPACVAKKRHVGNDFVNIIFNRSNRPFNFETIPSQFNSINIVITPVCRIAESDFSHELDAVCDYSKSFYVVRVMSKPGLPELSPASTPKVISGESLAAYVRILAINASVFSLVWNREGGEHISSWRNRLREIKRLRDRVMTSRTSSVDASESGFLGHRRNTRTNIHVEDEMPTQRSQMRPGLGDWNTDNNVSQALDFSRWTR
ncbi:Tuberous sclerosis 2 protein [Talaromyces pinophilus]|nr:Tuberous sclerosis 2 protein [Talaromyces pinophilus]